MSDEVDQDKGGEIRFTVSSQTMKYLAWLSRHTVLGKVENEVARQILTQRLSEMRQEEYRDGQKP